VLYCGADGSYLADEDATPPSPWGTWGRDCAEPLAQWLGSGFELVYSGASDTSAPVLYTLVRDPGDSGAGRLSPRAASEVALVRCQKEDVLERLVLSGYDTTKGAPLIRREYGASCAAAVRTALDAGLSLVNVRTGKNDSANVLYVLTTEPTRLRPNRRRRSGAVDAALVTCLFDYERDGQGSFFVIDGGTSTSAPSFDSQAFVNCAEALAFLLNAGFSTARD